MLSNRKNSAQTNRQLLVEALNQLWPNWRQDQVIFVADQPSNLEAPKTGVKSTHTKPAAESRPARGLLPAKRSRLADVSPQKPDFLSTIENIKTQTVECPLDGSEIARVKIDDIHDVSNAVTRARQAQENWRNVPVAHRARVIRKLKKLVLDNADPILNIITLENGKARTHAHEEIMDVCLNAGYYASCAKAVLKTRRAAGVFPLLTKTLIQHEPIGVVGVISPWNYPFNLALSDALAALVAGNAVVIKPASLTPISALIAKQLLERAGLNPDLFQVVLGSGSKIGDALVAHSDQIMFTGSTAVGKEVAAQAGKKIIPFSCELGGKNPLIVLPGINIRKAARKACQACFTNAGQLCLSVERIYVHAKIWDEFVRVFVKQTRQLKLGANFSWRTQMGPLASESQLKTVERHVEDARRLGAKVLCGGQRLNFAPYAYAPTVLTEVSPDAYIFSQETFGPVVSLYRVADVNEAITLANNTSYGLNAAVLGKPTEAAAVADRINSGSVNVNDGYAAVFSSVAAPAGGWKESGIGGRHGKEGLLKYTRTRTKGINYGAPLGAIPGVAEKTRAQVTRWYVRHLKK